MAAVCSAAPAPIDVAFPLPPTRPVMPVTALRHVGRLLENKEDTSQVFHIVRALSGGSERETARRAAATAYGHRVLSGEVDLAAELTDREPLRQLPEGTYGRLYADFMDREGLTPDGVNAAANEATDPEMLEDYRREFPELMRLFRHINASHDLWHVLTGYSRDALGEIALLAYTYRMSGNFGLRTIVFFGGLKYRRLAPGAPVGRIINEGLAIGAASRWLPGEDLPALFALPIEEARARMAIGPHPAYDAVPQDLKDEFGKPEEAVSASEPVAA